MKDYEHLSPVVLQNITFNSTRSYGSKNITTAIRRILEMNHAKSFTVTATLALLMSFSVGCNNDTGSPTTIQNNTLTAGTPRIDKKGIDQIWIPAGSFLMGTSEADAQTVLAQNLSSWIVNELNSEKPQHQINITHGYWIDKYEVTNAAFQAFVNDSGYQKLEFWSEDGKAWLLTRSFIFPPKNPGDTVANHPRTYITWYEAEAYAYWRGGRIPTEAEWEYAARRGPHSFIYPWGNIYDSSKTNNINSRGLMPVGSFPNGVSWVGAHDMAGNAMEWVQDWLDVAYYQVSPQNNPQGPNNGTIKVEKGGWWGGNRFVVRSAYRHFEDPPTYGDGHIGFRIVTQ